MDGGEFLVEYHMKLGAHVICGQIAHSSNQGRVLVAETKKLTHSSSSVELGDFLAILDLGI